MGAQDYASFTPLIDVCDAIADPRIFSMVIVDCNRQTISPAAFEFDVAPKENQSIIYTTMHGQLAFNHPVRGGTFNHRFGVVSRISTDCLKF